MSVTQWVLGVPLLGVVGGGVMRVIGAVIDPAAGIVVHSLEFTTDPFPSIIQDRTVFADNALTARWKASITANGFSIPECSGRGVWDYTAGHHTPKISIDRWVGSENCWVSIPENAILQACAEYTWGDGQTATQCTLSFRKEDHG